MKKPLTEKGLRKLIQQEAAKFKGPTDVEDVVKDTDEVDADEFADTLAKPIDMIAALKIEEARLERRLKVVRENKAKYMKKIVETAKRGK